MNLAEPGGRVLKEGAPPLPAQSSRLYPVLTSLRCPAVPSTHPTPTTGKCHGQWRQPRVCPALDSSVWGCDRRVAPKFLEGRGGRLQHELPACTRSEGVALDWGGLEVATRGGARRQPPARSRKHTRATARCTWCALAAAMPASPSLLRAATPALCPFALRSLTVTPAGRARRLAKPAGVPPRPPLGPPLPVLCALRPSQSPSPAARYFHTSQCLGPGA